MFSDPHIGPFLGPSIPPSGWGSSVGGRELEDSFGVGPGGCHSFPGESSSATFEPGLHTLNINLYFERVDGSRDPGRWYGGPSSR